MLPYPAMLEIEKTYQCPVCLAIETLTFFGSTLGNTRNWKQRGSRVFHKDCGRPCNAIDGHRTRQLTSAFMTLFLKELMRQRGRLPSQLAADLGVSHATVGRWLCGKAVPRVRSCKRLAMYSGVPLANILNVAGHGAKLGVEDFLREQRQD